MEHDITMEPRDYMWAQGLYLRSSSLFYLSIVGSGGASWIVSAIWPRMRVLPR